MTIIRGEKIEDIAILTPTKELYFPRKDPETGDLFKEECQKAFLKGKEAGEKIGFGQASEEVKVFLKLLQTMTEKLLEHKKRLLDQLKPEVIEFAIMICERIIRKELSQPEAMVKLINSLLSFSTTQLRQKGIQIFLSPDDLVMLENQLSKIQYDRKEIESIRFHSDPMMRCGDCRIETKTGLLNYDISRELSDLQSKVLQR